MAEKYENTEVFGVILLKINFSGTGPRNEQTRVNDDEHMQVQHAVTNKHA